MNYMDPQNISLQPQQPEQSIYQQHQSMRLLLIIGVFILLFIVGVGAFYLGKRQANQPPVTNLTPTTSTFSTPTLAPTVAQDETANWKIYTNTKYNYILKYPDDYSLTEVSLDHVRLSPGPSEPNLPQRQTYLSIQLDNTSQTTPGVIYKKAADGSTLRISQVIMDIDESQKPKVKTTFNQILSTFKFLDQKSTYICPQNGWVDCMPILSEEAKKACSTEAIAWYKTNCPNYKGIAQ